MSINTYTNKDKWSIVVQKDLYIGQEFYYENVPCKVKSFDEQKYGKGMCLIELEKPNHLNVQFIAIDQEFFWRANFPEWMKPVEVI